MIEFKINRYETLDSTNSFLSDLIEKNAAEEGLLITTGEQSNGKGYGSNNWHSEKNKNLLFSYLTKPDFLDAAKQFYLSMITSLAITDTLSMFIPADKLRIKWPNDIYYDKNKIAGILIENRITGEVISSSITGIGLNVNQMNFPANLPNPTSMAMISGKSFNTDIILNAFTANINNWYDKLKNNILKPVLNRYLSLLYLKNTNAEFKNGNEIFRGMITGIDRYGRLKIKTENKIRIFDFKEIEYL